MKAHHRVHARAVVTGALVAVALLLAVPAPTSAAVPAPPGQPTSTGRAHPNDVPNPALIAASRAGIATTTVDQSVTAATPSENARPLATRIRPAAAAAMTDCSELYQGPFRCGSISVPTSADDPSLGTRTIDFVYRPADVQPALAVSLFTDGTVQSTFSESSPWKAQFFAWIAAAQGAEFATRDVILVNTRGTGRDAVDCPLLQSVGNPVREAVTECVGILGRSIDYFTTGDSADDLDAVRAYLLGRTATIDLVSMGHSTSVGQAYLARYPQRVHTAILDEAQNINAWGDVEIKDSTAILGLSCQRSARCSAQIRDAVAQVRWLAATVRTSPVVGTTTLPDGTPQRIVLGEAELAWGLVAPEPSSYAFGAGLSAAIKSFRAGDNQPLLRLAANAGIGEGFGTDPVTNPVDTAAGEWSAAGFAAANCNEWSTAYDLSADETTRRTQAAARLAAQPANLYGIFSHGIYGTWEECWSWPGPARVNPINPAGVRFAKVPVLVMAGDLNTDHPPTAARTVGDRYPQATFVTIPRAGQPSLYWSACAARIAQHFMTTATTGNTRCSANEGKAILGIGSFPRSVAQEKPARPASAADRSTARDRRVAALAVHTAIDGVLQALDAGGGVAAGPALRGGTFSTVIDDDGATITLQQARFADDVSVSGDVDYSFVADNAPAQLTVSGAGTAKGRLVVEMPALFSLDHPTAHVTGRIGGRPVDLTVDIQ